MRDGHIRFKAETTFGVSGLTKDAWIQTTGRVPAVGRTVAVEHSLSARIECECGAEIMFERTLSPEEAEIPMHWTGVPCSGCERTFTVWYTPDD